MGFQISKWAGRRKLAAWVLMFGVMLVAALALRIHVINTNAYGFPKGWGAEMASIASAILRGEGMSSPYWEVTGPTALLMPVYPHLLAGIFSLSGGYSPAGGYAAMIVNAFISTATTALVFLIGRKVFDAKVGLTAAWLWALYPLTGYTEAIFIWNTSLNTFLLMLMALIGLHMNVARSRRSWFAFGLLAGLALLVDTTPLLFLPLMLGWLWFSRGARLGQIGLFGLGLALLVGPWIARNAVEFGVPVLRSGLGFELHRGVTENDFATIYGTIYSPTRLTSEMEKYQTLGELDYMNNKMETALGVITSDPVAYVKRTARRAWAFWTGSANIMHIYWYFDQFPRRKQVLFSLSTVLGLAGLGIMFRRKVDGRWLFLGLLVSHSVIYYFTITHPRYRAPLEPTLLLVSAFALVSLYRALWGRKWAISLKLPVIVGRRKLVEELSGS